MVSASSRARSLILAGLPMPECNLIIGGDQGPMGRVDLVYLAYKLIIEYEGGDKHRTDRGQWNRDIDRQEDFARDHWMLIRVTSERARWPRQVVRAVYKALRSTVTTVQSPNSTNSG
jgi:very-short-patch-repair endonuclease